MPPARGGVHKPVTGTPPTSDANLAGGFRETQQWVERSIQRCQFPATARFLEMVSARINARLREMDNPGGVCDYLKEQ